MKQAHRFFIYTIINYFPGKISIHVKWRRISFRLVKETNFSDWSNVLQQQVLPLTKEFKVNFDKSLLQEIKDGKPEVKSFLAEKGDYLFFQPLFSYKGFETKAKDRDEVVVPAGDKVMIVHRNRPAEQEFIAKMQNLHCNFIYQEDSQALALKGIRCFKK